MLVLPNGGCLIESHPLDVPLRRLAEQAGILTAELRRALAAHTRSGVSGIKVLIEHQLPGFLQAQLLLVVNRTAPLGNSPLRRSVPKKATAEISP